VSPTNSSARRPTPGPSAPSHRAGQRPVSPTNSSARRPTPGPPAPSHRRANGRRRPTAPRVDQRPGPRRRRTARTNGPASPTNSSARRPTPGPPAPSHRAGQRPGVADQQLRAPTNARALGAVAPRGPTARRRRPTAPHADQRRRTARANGRASPTTQPTHAPDAPASTTSVHADPPPLPRASTRLVHADLRGSSVHDFRARRPPRLQRPRLPCTPTRRRCRASTRLVHADLRDSAAVAPRGPTPGVADQQLRVDPDIHAAAALTRAWQSVHRA